MLLCVVQALEHKARGNELYKARQFDEALEEYGKAIELYDKDVSFLTNRCVDTVVALVSEQSTVSWQCQETVCGGHGLLVFWGGGGWMFGEVAMGSGN